MAAYIDDMELKGIDYTATPLEKGNYEVCHFVDCNFSGSDLSENTFIDCTFDGCDMSMALLESVGLQNVKFKNCKLLGIHFDRCSTFSLEVAFESCILNLASFYKLNLKNTIFKKCTMKEVDLVEANLTGSSFIECDLTSALFDRTNLEKVDFRTSYNYSINPTNNILKKAKFSADGIRGLLNEFNIIIE